MKYWAIIPAAGKGMRLGAVCPKQYLKISGKMVIEHTLDQLCRHESLSGVVVAISPDDDYWSSVVIDAPMQPITVEGGSQRCYSVQSAVKKLLEVASPNDWVMVHDAVRACLTHDEIDALIKGVSDHKVGGLLGVPVADTIKQCDNDGNVQETVKRDGLWRAQTPQMFRLGVLSNALSTALASGFEVTDEASAIEAMGLVPKMIEGSPENIKITYASDLLLAESILENKK